MVPPGPGLAGGGSLDKLKAVRVNPKYKVRQEDLQDGEWTFREGF
jgi:hypothetical protein